VSDGLRHAVAVVGWLLAVVVIALGGAGLVAATDPGTGRAEQARLAYTGDATVEPALDAAEAELASLAADVDALGTQARGALAATVAGDADTVDAAIASGDDLLAGIVVRAAALKASLAAIPYVGDADAPLHVSPGVLARWARLAGAVDPTDGLEAAWARLSVSSSAAGRLSAQLAEHDRLVAQAAKQGRDAKYATAIKTLKEADKVIEASKASRDRIQNTVDVTVLDEWLARNAAYDKALAALYDALDSVGGRVTTKVKRAIAAEKAARAKLPPDSRGLVIIMGDIAQGGLNGAVVAIEEAKAEVAAALEPEPEPGASPSAVP
jgi:hypothetical protein